MNLSQHGFVPPHCSVSPLAAHRALPKDAATIHGVRQHHHIRDGRQHPPGGRLRQPPPHLQRLPAPPVCQGEPHHQEPEARDAGKATSLYQGLKNHHHRHCLFLFRSVPCPLCPFESVPLHCRLIPLSCCITTTSIWVTRCGKRFAGLIWRAQNDALRGRAARCAPLRCLQGSLPPNAAHFCQHFLIPITLGMCSHGEQQSSTVPPSSLQIH